MVNYNEDLFTMLMSRGFEKIKENFKSCFVVSSMLMMFLKWSNGKWEKWEKSQLNLANEQLILYHLSRVMWCL